MCVRRDGRAKALAVAAVVAAAGVVHTSLEISLGRDLRMTGLEQLTLNDPTALHGPEPALRVLGARVDDGIRGLGAALARVPGVGEEGGRGLGRTSRRRLEVVGCVIVKVAAETLGAALPLGGQAQQDARALVPLEHEPEVRHVQEDEETRTPEGYPFYVLKRARVQIS